MKYMNLFMHRSFITTSILLGATKLRSMGNGLFVINACCLFKCLNVTGFIFVITMSLSSILNPLLKYF